MVYYVMVYYGILWYIMVYYGILWYITMVYNRYSEQTVRNLTKKRTPPPVFSGEVFENGWLWTAASEQPKWKISKNTFLVESF